MKYISDEDLLHHGVPGMKWGVRNEKIRKEIKKMETREKRTLTLPKQAKYSVAQYSRKLGSVASVIGGLTMIGAAFSANPVVGAYGAYTALYGQMLMNNANQMMREQVAAQRVEDKERGI